MSKIALSGNAAGTGTFTLAAPNSNADRTLMLPDVGGTVLLNSDFTGTNVLLAAEGYQKLPSGFIIQWGQLANSTGSPLTETFPIAFPTACVAVNILLGDAGTSAAFCSLNGVPTTASFAWNAWSNSTTRVGGFGGRYIAIGY